MATNVIPTAEAQTPTYTTLVTTTYLNIYKAQPTQQNADQPDSQNNGSPWDNMGAGIKSAIAMFSCLVTLVIIIASVWYCCGCCGLRQKRRERRRREREATNPNPRRLEQAEIQETQRGGIVQRGGIAQRPGVTAGPFPAGEAPPPQYDEIVPPQHRTISGGITHVREEEEGVISDGKMPLSEMAFEDVVLDHSPSEGSARTFQERHYRAGGDTTGHTNV